MFRVSSPAMCAHGVSDPCDFCNSKNESQVCHGTIKVSLTILPVLFSFAFIGVGFSIFCFFEVGNFWNFEF